MSESFRILWLPEEHPGETLGIRRHSDRCFHAAEEETEDGYIVQGVLFPRDEIAEVSITRGTDVCEKRVQRYEP